MIPGGIEAAEGTPRDHIYRQEQQYLRTLLGKQPFFFGQYRFFFPKGTIHQALEYYDIAKNPGYPSNPDAIDLVRYLIQQHPPRNLPFAKERRNFQIDNLLTTPYGQQPMTKYIREFLKLKIAGATHQQLDPATEIDFTQMALLTRYILTILEDFFPKRTSEIPKIGKKGVLSVEGWVKVSTLYRN